MNKKVSVIIPVYNAERYVGACIESVISQTYENIEIIVINDGSTDTSDALIRNMAKKDNRIKYITQENHGVSYTRNRGIEMANGTYVVFVDADDLVLPDYVKAMVESLENNCIQMAVCGYQQISEQGEIQQNHLLKSELISGIDTIEHLLQFRNITSALWNKMFCLDRIHEKRIQFKPEFSIGEDMVFLTEYCLGLDRVCILADILYCYRENPNGAMLGNSKVIFDRKWLTEWNAICEVERLLYQHENHLHMTDVKKIRIADKLLTKITKSQYDNLKLKKELQQILRKHIGLVIMEKDFTIKKKISCLLNAISPKLHNAFLKQ